jgi:hypothetical protein
MAAEAVRIRSRSLSNLSRMGHCAPTVMQTLLDLSGTRSPWLVRLAAGLPGGIGNTGAECGGITASLAMLGLRHAQEPPRLGVPVAVYKGHELLRRFRHACGATRCREIRGEARLPLACVRAILKAPELCAEVSQSDCQGALSTEAVGAYRRLHGHCFDANFHCAHDVLHRLSDVIPVTEELLDASSPFIGGQVYAGMTCSAYAAGVMALGLARGEIEDSRLRVLRMIGTLAAGGDAFADHLNAFSRTMNSGHRLGEWFASRFGSTECRTITRCDFATHAGAWRFIQDDGVAKCSAMAQEVAREVRAMLAS